MTVRSTSNRLLIDHQKTLKSERWVLKWLKSFSIQYTFWYLFIRFWIYILTFKSMRNRWSRFCHQILWRICQYPHLIAIVLVIEIFEKSIFSKSSGFESSLISQSKLLPTWTFSTKSQSQFNDEAYSPEEFFYRLHWHLKNPFLEKLKKRCKAFNGIIVASAQWRFGSFYM